MLCEAKVAVCSDIHPKHSTQSERHVEFLNVTPLWYVKKPLGVKRLIYLFFFFNLIPERNPCILLATQSERNESKQTKKQNKKERNMTDPNFQWPWTRGPVSLLHYSVTKEDCRAVTDDLSFCSYNGCQHQEKGKFWYPSRRLRDNKPVFRCYHTEHKVDSFDTLAVVLAAVWLRLAAGCILLARREAKIVRLR